MSRAILLVDHGSRREEANAQLDALARRLRERVDDAIVETAHLEIAPPDIGEGIDRCVERGAREVLVLPYFLGPGRHTTRDIPAAVEAAAARHPGVALRVCDPLGLHEKLVEVLLERIEQAASD